MCFILSLSKKVEFFGSLSLSLTLLTLQLFTEVLSFGLGVERSHSDSDSHGQQPGAGEGWTWENRQPHVVQPTGGLAPAWKSASFEWSKIPHFPGPTGIPRGQLIPSLKAGASIALQSPHRDFGGNVL